MVRKKKKQQNSTKQQIGQHSKRYLYSFQMMCLQVLRGEVNQKNEVAGRLRGTDMYQQISSTHEPCLTIIYSSFMYNAMCAKLLYTCVHIMHLYIIIILYTQFNNLFICTQNTFANYQEQTHTHTHTHTPLLTLAQEGEGSCLVHLYLCQLVFPWLQPLSVFPFPFQLYPKKTTKCNDTQHPTPAHTTKYVDPMN